ncbi:MAG: TrmH family RNA methyltransferase [Eubacteriales bacterium]
MEKTPDMITSRKNPSVVFSASLSDKKQRDKTGLFAFEGIKLLIDAAKEHIDIENIFASSDACIKYGDIFESIGVSGKITPVADAVYEKLSFENAPQGIFTVARKIKQAEKTYKDDAFVMLLDAVADPGNLGTIIRSADAFGVDTVYVGAGSADIYNPKTVRASMGSLFRMNVITSHSLASDIRTLKEDGFSIYAAMLDKNSENILSLELSHGRVGFVVGNEGNGVCREVLEACGKSVIIPMREGPESLNAASCAALLEWEVFKSRLNS